MGDFCPHCTVIGPSEAQKAKDAERNAQLSVAAMERAIAPMLAQMEVSPVGEAAAPRTTWDVVKELFDDMLVEERRRVRTTFLYVRLGDVQNVIDTADTLFRNEREAAALTPSVEALDAERCPECDHPIDKHHDYLDNCWQAWCSCPLWLSKLRAALGSQPVSE